MSGSPGNQGSNGRVDVASNQGGLFSCEVHFECVLRVAPQPGTLPTDGRPTRLDIEWPPSANRATILPCASS